MMTVADSPTRMVSPAQWPLGSWQPDTVLRMFGMRRCGNHAVANWLQRNAPKGQALFFNNCKAARMPFAHHHGVEKNGQRVSRQDSSDLSVLGARMGQGGLMLMSYEDVVPSDHCLSRPVSGELDETLISADVILLRGFLNWSASLVKKLQRNPDFSLAHRSGVVMRAIDSYRKMLDLAAEADALALVVIDYDQWVKDEACRAACLGRLGLLVRDNSLGVVQSYGGGSSFDEQASGSAFGLRTDQRWQRMMDDGEYLAILHLAARDEALMRGLSRRYPDDAARLAGLTHHKLIPAEGLLQ